MVNDASVGVRGEPGELLAEPWWHAIDVDLDGAIHSCQGARLSMEDCG